jgi:membrane protease YdiL (CAAX protease family)
VYAPAILVIAPLIAAAWFSAAVPYLIRQTVLCVWGVGATVALDRLLFGGTLLASVRTIGFAPARMSAVFVAIGVSLPMWFFLPAFAWLKGTSLQLRADWAALLLGVVLVNGITEEAIHRGFVFDLLRRGRSFIQAATLSALLFGAQHLYLVATIGWTAGLASVLLALLLAFPLAYCFERGGRSIAAPAILHTSSNAPVVIVTSSGDFLNTALLPHMGVVLMSLYGVFVFRRLLVPGTHEWGPR